MVRSNTTPATKPAKSPRRHSARIDGNAWIQAALSILAERGISGVRVETLAKQLGVTKGSFYWHFKDRDALFDALLDSWRRVLTRPSRAPPDGYRNCCSCLSKERVPSAGLTLSLRCVYGAGKIRAPTPHWRRSTSSVYVILPDCSRIPDAGRLKPRPVRY